MGILLKYVVALAAVGAAVAVLEIVGPSVNGATAAQVLLVVVLIDARYLGTRPALAASVAAAVGFTHYFVTPGGFAYGDPNDWAALASFLIIAVVGGDLAVRAERRAVEAQRGRQEIERLYQELQAAFDRVSEVEAARRNERLKSALLDALTHNLRTPLTAIKAAVTALIGVGAWKGVTMSTTEERDLLQVIDEESDRLNRFIEGLSTQSVDDPTVPMSFSPVDVGGVLRDAIARAESLTRDHRVVCAVGDVPSVSVDRASLTEVIYILLDNASKYAPPGTTIRVAAERDGDRRLCVTVADEGPGIPADLRERVFEKFFRIPNRATFDTRRVGIGLGLPIARRLLEAQAGRIWIEAPAAGQTGTTVALTLPTVSASAEPEHAGTASVA